MLSANFKPKRIAAASRGFLATARLSCIANLLLIADSASERILQYLMKL